MVGREKWYAAVIVARNLSSENLRRDIAELDDSELEDFAAFLRVACKQQLASE